MNNKKKKKILKKYFTNNDDYFKFINKDDVKIIKVEYSHNFKIIVHYVII